LGGLLGAAGIPVCSLTGAGVVTRAEWASDRVKIVTFHSSKGLEFPVAAIPGLGFLPSRHSEESDEVRLGYVAMTRAMDRLIMTYHRRSLFVERLLGSDAPLAA
jgi:superfamily I DNA/RNA helicase